MSFFAEYNFEVKYKAGKHNVLADALSRRPVYEIVHVTSYLSSISDLIRVDYARDNHCVSLRCAFGIKYLKDLGSKLSTRTFTDIASIRVYCAVVHILRMILVLLFHMTGN